MGIRNHSKLWRATPVRLTRSRLVQTGRIIRPLARPFKWFINISQIRRASQGLRRAFYRLPLAARYSLFGFALLGLAILSVGIYTDRQYSLNQAEQQLLGKVGVSTKFITESDTGYAYSAQKEEDLGNGQHKMTLAASAMDATGDDPYTATLPKQPGDPIKFGAGKGTPGFSLTPLFDTGDARTSDDEGRVLYAKGSNELHAYTFKKNGIKQDIIVRAHITDELNYQWKLNLGKDLEAKLQENGALNIYGPDTELLANATAGTDADKALLEKAKQNAAKTKLLYVIPAPYIKDASGQTDYDNASFKLDKDTLTLTAKNLDTKKYPISIDPTVTVDTTAQFRLGNDDGMIRYATADDGEIERQTISAGSLGTTTMQDNIFTSDRSAHATAIYNGYIYILGGAYSSGVYDDISYCAISGSDGSITGCTQQTSAFVTARFWFSATAYNGFLYLNGGDDGSCCQFGDVQFAKINSNGSLSCPGGSYTCSGDDVFHQVNSVTTDRANSQILTYNGYLYIVGGGDDDIYRCLLRADGMWDTCTRQNPGFSGGIRFGHTAFAYNGYIYIAGGQIGGTNQNDILGCPISSSDGSVGTCVTAGTFTTARRLHAAVAYKGYMYIMGGYDVSSNMLSDTQYCPIYANGTVGTCTATNSFTTARIQFGAVAYDGYLYTVAGSTLAGGVQNDIQRLRVDPVGQVLTSTETSATYNATGRSGAAVSVLNGYIYIMGGYTGGSSTETTTIDVCTISSSGTISGCSTSGTALPANRGGAAGAAYNGYIYAVGGTNSTLGYGTNTIIRCPVSGTTVSACTNQTTAFTTGRTNAAASIYVGSSSAYLIISGGEDNLTPDILQDIIYCPLSSGTPTCNATQNNYLVNDRQSMKSAVLGDYLYLAGGVGNASSSGCDSNSYCNDIQRCALSPSTGAPSACTNTGTTGMFTPTRTGNMTIYGGYIYVVGGLSNGSSYNNDIWRCPITSESAATVGSCTQQTSAFTNARNGHGVVAYNGYLYIVGGRNASTLYTDVRSLSLNMRPNFTNVGVPSAGTGSPQASVFGGGRSSHATVAVGSWLYIIGGVEDGLTGEEDDVVRCPLNPNGSVGTCDYSQTNAFLYGRYDHSATYSGGFIYIAAGTDSGQAWFSDLQYSYVNPSTGALECPPGKTCGSGRVFAVATADVTNYQGSGCGPSYSTLTAYNNFLYCVGGYDSDGVQYKDIAVCATNTDGEVPSCTFETEMFDYRSAHGAAAYNGYLYIVGGRTGPFGAEVMQRDIEYCDLHPTTGLVGTCTRIALAFTTTRAYPVVAAYDGYLFIGGGTTGWDGGNTYQSDMNSCPIGLNGVPGTCTSTSSILSTGRAFHGGGVVADNGYVYQAGGFNNGCTNSWCSDVQFFRANVQSNHARYERVIDNGATTAIYSSISYNASSGTAKCNIDVRYAFAQSAGTYGSTITKLGVRPATTTSLSGSTAGDRYMRLIITMPDSSCGSTTSISDITLTYVDPPAAPTLSAPSASATGVSTTPLFQFESTNAGSYYMQYMIQVCTDSNCNSPVRTICQATPATYPTGVSSCTTASQTGWTGQDAGPGSNTAYTGGTTLGGSTLANHTYQATALNEATQYYWRAWAIDPGGFNEWGSPSSVQSFTTYSPASAPTLIEPVSSTGITVLPTFRLRSTDAASNYIRYMIQLCSDSNCNTPIAGRAYCQATSSASGSRPACTASQTGWQGQDQQTATAYTGAPTLANSTIGIFTLPSPNLVAGTYYWRAWAIDPADYNTWSAESSIGSFTVGDKEIRILGNTRFLPNTKIGD